jgi:hypothetical protein
MSKCDNHNLLECQIRAEIRYLVESEIFLIVINHSRAAALLSQNSDESNEEGHGNQD